ncbi:MAG: ABC transporter substrate-binding protein [Opitutaceae bacterium]|nr:ABC transporter substrate-binding protein [Opitutaceae bacterium]
MSPFGRARVLRRGVLGAVLATTFLRAAPDAGRIHLSYWEKWAGIDSAGMRAVVAAFNEAQSRYVVEYLPVSQIERKVVVATAGGDPPDIAGLWAQNVASFADNEAILPLEDLVRRDGGTTDQWLARYYPVYADICRHQGRMFAAVSTPATIALHWNKALFREVGLDPERPPRTLAELDEFSRRLAKRDPATGAILRLGFLPQEPDWWPWLYCAWFGGQLFDGRAVTLGTDPRNLAAMRWVAGYTRDAGLASVTTFASGFGKYGTPQTAFLNGKIAMMFQGVWFNNFIQKFRPGLDYGVAPFPAAQAGVEDFTLAEADVLVIPRGARHADGAWEFIKFVNSHNAHAQNRSELQGMELLCFLQQKNSPLRDWSPFFTQHHPHPHIAEFRRLSASPHAIRIPDVGVWQEYDRECKAMFERVRLLVATPEEAIAYTHARVSASWARHQLSLVRHGQLAEAPSPTRAP